MSDKRYPIENLKKWQDSILQTARKLLRDDGERKPVAFFLTEKMNIEERLQQVAVAFDANTEERMSLTSDEVKPSDPIIIVLDLLFDEHRALEVVKQSMPPEQALFVTMLEAQGAKFGAQNPTGTVLKVLMARLGVDFKDIAAMAIRLVIKKTDAIAYVKIDETWMVQSKLDNLPDKEAEEEILKFRAEHGSLENHPDAKEAIMSFLETDGFTRMVSVKFNRNRPKTGRVIGFEDPVEWIETSDEASAKLDGRFSHLFHKAKAEPKPPVHPNAN